MPNNRPTREAIKELLIAHFKDFCKKNGLNSSQETELMLLFELAERNIYNGAFKTGANVGYEEGKQDYRETDNPFC